MEKIKKYKILILGIILILGFVLRSNNIYTWPRTGATFDEYAWTWLGMNLIQNKVPESWSPHPQYKNAKDVFYDKVHFRLVKPYLEHPPLFGLIAGSYAIFNGVDQISRLTIRDIRGLSLILGIFSILLVYLLATEIYGYKIGLLSSFIYSITPTVVVGSRIVQNENFFIPVFLLSLFFVSKFIKTNNASYRNITAALCGLLILAKIPWIVAAFAISMIFIFLKRYKDLFKFSTIIILISLLYLFYGLYYDANLFMSILSFQLNRYDMQFNSFFALFTSPYLVDRFLIDGWIYFGWFTMFILFIKDIKKNYMVIFPFLAYLLIFIIAIPNEPSHGWYRYPFYPFITISIALFLKEHFNKNYLLTFIFLIFTGLSMLQLSWGQSFGFSYIILRFFVMFFSLSLMPLFFAKTKKISDFTSFISIFIITILSIWTIIIYNEQ